jgi:hypothetical protein
MFAEKCWERLKKENKNDIEPKKRMMMMKMCR